MDLPEKVILMTGITSGIGLVLVEEIASVFKETHQLHLCVSCRNMSKGESLKKMIAINHQSVKVTLIHMDVGSVESVLRGCEEITKRFAKLDCMYLNAGIMPVKHFNWIFMLKTLFYDWNVVDMFRTGYGMFDVDDYINEEGVNNVFATNVLGHFILVQELLPLLRDSGGLSQIIWTTSTNASKNAYDPKEVTGKFGCNSYSNSKYVLEATSIELNSKFNNLGVYSHVADPGTSITNLTGGALPFWIWYIALPILWLARLLLPNLTITPYNACQSLLWLSGQNPQDLDPTSKYCSRTSLTNSNYILKEKMEIKSDNASRIYQNVSSVACKISSKYKQ